MSRIVHVGSMGFSTRGDYGNPGELRKTILRETAEKLRNMSGFGLDLVLTTENIGYYTHDPAEPEALDRPGALMELYAEFARSERCYVAGSVVLYDQGRKYNTLTLFNRNGEAVECYRKNFLTFGPGSEVELGFTSGNGIVCADTAIGRIGMAVCFDLNFAELRTRYKEAKPDILCFSSMYHGGLMQSMWAYDLRSFFIAALPAVNAPYGIMNPFGLEVKFASSYVPDPMAKINLDRVMMHLTWNREKFADIVKKYGDEVTLEVPPSIGSALLYSNSAERSALDIANEFELVLLDDFMEQARLINAGNR